MFSASDEKRIIDAVVRVEGMLRNPEPQRATGPRDGGNRLALLRITSGTATSGRYPAKVQSYDAATKTLTDGADCWAVEPGGSALTTGYRIGHVWGSISGVSVYTVDMDYASETKIGIVSIVTQLLKGNKWFVDTTRTTEATVDGHVWLGTGDLDEAPNGNQTVHPGIFFVNVDSFDDWEESPDERYSVSTEFFAIRALVNNVISAGRVLISGAVGGGNPQNASAELVIGDTDDYQSGFLLRDSNLYPKYQVHAPGAAGGTDGIHRGLYDIWTWHPTDPTSPGSEPHFTSEATGTRVDSVVIRGGLITETGSSGGSGSGSGSRPGGGSIDSTGLGTASVQDGTTATLSDITVADGALLVISVAWKNSTAGLTATITALFDGAYSFSQAVKQADTAKRFGCAIYYWHNNTGSDQTGDLVVEIGGTGSTPDLAFAAVEVTGLVDNDFDNGSTNFLDVGDANPDALSFAVADDVYAQGAIATLGSLLDADGTWGNDFTDGGQDAGTFDVRLCEGFSIASSAGTAQPAKTGITPRPWVAVGASFT